MAVGNRKWAGEPKSSERAAQAASRTASHGGEASSSGAARRSTQTRERASIFSSRCGASTVMARTRSPKAPMRSAVVEGGGTTWVSLCSRGWQAGPAEGALARGGGGGRGDARVVAVQRVLAGGEGRRQAPRPGGEVARPLV